MGQVDGDMYLCLQILSFLAYFLRGHTDQYDSQLENLLLNVLRMLQDCPASAVAPRKVSIRGNVPYAML